ncbi:hypothetical protein HER21_47875, partial [Pseudomonas sp. BGM005]|nr:hypothetical protein [Pseudomonas sp. BG5]
ENPDLDLDELFPERLENAEYAAELAEQVQQQAQAGEQAEGQAEKA